MLKCNVADAVSHFCICNIFKIMTVIPKVSDRKTIVFLQEYHSKLSVTIKNPANLLQDYHKNITKGPRDYYRKARFTAEI